MRNMKSNVYRAVTVGLISCFGILSGATLAIAATTISTNIAADGTLSVTGQSTLTGQVAIGNVGTGGLSDISNSVYVSNILTAPTYEENAFIGLEYAPTSTTDGNDVNNLFLAYYPGGSAHKVGNVNLQCATTFTLTTTACANVSNF
jgi:hypothetical protein